MLSAWLMISFIMAIYDVQSIDMTMDIKEVKGILMMKRVRTHGKMYNEKLKKVI